MELLSLLAFLVGAFYLMHFLKAFIYAIWPYFLRKDLNLEYERYGKGTYALITGATDG